MAKDNVIIDAVIQKKATMTQPEKPIVVRVVCKYQYAVAMFSDKKMAKKLAKAESKAGKDVRYDEKLNVMVERFTGKTAKEVATIVAKQMKNAGGELK